MLLEVFIIMKESSILLLRRSFMKDKQLGVDGQLFSGLISAISRFIEEIKIGQIQHFQTGDHRVLVMPYKGIVVVGVVEERKEDAFVNTSLERIAEQFWDQYEEIVKKDDCNLKLFRPFVHVIDDIVYSEFTKRYVTKDFPHQMIKVVREFQRKFEDRIVRFIGEKAGKFRAKSLDSSKDLRKVLDKELGQFSLNEVEKVHSREILIKVPMCPICRKIKDESFSCEFLAGYLRGFAVGSLEHAEVNVEETKCIAKGDKRCVFRLEW